LTPSTTPERLVGPKALSDAEENGGQGMNYVMATVQREEEEREPSISSMYIYR